MISMPSLPVTSGAYAGGAAIPKTVKVAGLNHYFGEGELRKQALFENLLEVRRGEIVIMTGPSGSGKTTLLTLIGTLRTVCEGSLKVLGHELNGASRELINRLRQDLGFIFQAHNLFESLTAFQNVNMACELVGIERAVAKDRICGLLERLGLGDRIHYKPDQLSGGQKQRVAVARGLVHKPRIVLADEPTAALDEKSGREVVTLFQEMAEQEGSTIIMVTHDSRILDVADRIVNMVDGRIRSDVDVQETSVICEFLRQYPLFANLQTSTLTEVADMMQVEYADEDDAVIRQGDPGEKFYLIRDGNVDVVVEKDGETRTVAQLGKGQYFGEAALLRNLPRNATVVARDRATFYTLGKKDFKEVTDKSKTFVDELRNVLASRT